MIEAKSAITKTFAVPCPQCRAAIGEPCVRPDGQRVEFKGHLGSHWKRLVAARHVKRDTA